MTRELELPPNAIADFRFLSKACGWFAALLPALVALWRTHLWAQWRDDLGVLRTVGLLPIGAEGVVSSALGQLPLLLPVEGRAQRAALVGVVAIAVFGRLTFSLSLHLLRRQGTLPRLSPLLALAVSLISTLCPVAQSEATTVGGGTVAACIALAIVALPMVWAVGDARLWAATGALLGFAAAENHAVALAAFGALCVQSLLHFRLPDHRTAVLSFLGFAVALTFCLLPAVLRPYSQNAWVDLGLAWGGGSTVASSPAQVLDAWMSEVGPIHCVLAVAGAALLAVDPRGRRLFSPMLAFLAIDLLVPRRGDGLFVPDALLASRLVGVAALAIASGVAVQVGARVLGATRLPMARPAAALLVAFTFTLVLISVEDSAQRLERDSARASDAWTKEAMTSLPRDALALVHSPELAWRLWAAQALSGRRQDVVVVPIHLLGHGSVAASLLAVEPALLDTIREMSVAGAPSEYALSALADARPLFVEFDPNWHEALMDHVTPELLWFRFLPHSIGRSDRARSLVRDDEGLARILKAATTATARDEATLSLIARHTRTKAVVLAEHGDRDGATRLLGHLRRLQPGDPFIDELSERLGRKRTPDDDFLTLLR